VATRREARRIAVDILYQADVTDDAALDVAAGWEAAERDVPPFAHELVEGVVEHAPEIDLLLETHSEGWRLARMAALDRTILRVALFELLWREDVPDSVAISEAVETANELSTEESGRFVNGVLGKIARETSGSADR
jgi:transcription antitermination protein NusB